jgi:hypothetical protein
MDSDQRGMPMKRFIQGDHRGQSALLPESLDDYVADTNPVRVVDVFVDERDLGTHFLTRTLDRVSTEMSLQVLAYNLKRALTVLGSGALVAAMKA